MQINNGPLPRTYTVEEIDDLSAVVEHVWLWGSLDTDGCSRSYKPHEKEIAVQERVRTYMMAGVTADDIRRKYGK